MSSGAPPAKDSPTIAGAIDVAELRALVLCEVAKMNQANLANSKDSYRAAHIPAVHQELDRMQIWIRRKYPHYLRYFANGDEVYPELVDPYLVQVSSPWHADLFRLARLTWSLPFNKGYGRRLRFLIMDRSNDKLIGILGLQSPPLDFPVRDRRFIYPQGRKVELVNQTMDIYTLGAIQPYNQLLGGKLIALAAASDEVRIAYARKYAGRDTQISQREISSCLVALTTTSAFGRSSIYNRLKFEGRAVAYSIGYTEGYGSFHLATLYPLLRQLLESQGVSSRGGFGVGPRIVWQTCVRGLQRLGLPSSLLKHGLKREAFLFPLISNLEDYMTGHCDAGVTYIQPFDDLKAWWRDRWMLPRSERVDDWRNWKGNRALDDLLLGGV